MAKRYLAFMFSSNILLAIKSRNPLFRFGKELQRDAYKLASDKINGKHMERVPDEIDRIASATSSSCAVIVTRHPSVVLGRQVERNTFLHQRMLGSLNFNPM
ncbi:hypothetical protein K1T71_007516 [Dendrolimus kikuchii]|uniref:Uncharacterized protein n=1 Tax=Dendrolimus kikuchii TaxID=765133 RepID=A0ACC1D1U7_9NEOP|nr:hypothetical protein K1T71_007516 [Dendrolimus kikuchii]